MNADGTQRFPSMPPRSSQPPPKLASGACASIATGVRDDHSSRRKQGVLARLAQLLSPRSALEGMAASTIQRYMRAHFARYELLKLRTAHRVVQMLATTERRAVMLIQSAWLDRTLRRQSTAAIGIQACIRASWDRRRVRTAAELLASQRARKAELKAQLLKGCSAILQKQSRPLSFWSWEIILWQQRLVFATEDALVYQHVSTDAEPSGPRKQVPFSSMRTIKALVLQHELLIDTRTRSYLFRLRCGEDAKQWADNLVQLSADAGCKVRGIVVHTDEQLSTD